MGKRHFYLRYSIMYYTIVLNKIMNLLCHICSIIIVECLGELQELMKGELAESLPNRDAANYRECIRMAM